jgi:hypothetical protein
MKESTKNKKNTIIQAANKNICFIDSVILDCTD